MQNNDKAIVGLSRFLSLILRHKPFLANICLDNNGWANVDELIIGVNATGKNLTKELLEEIVEKNNKKRFIFNDDQSMIRACQGHSVKVDLELKEGIPPVHLYHGTATRFLENIRIKGLLKQRRHHVHLSSDISIALSVGKRHGDAAVLQIDTAALLKDGYKFYLSQNNVWLCDSVPWKYITVLQNS